MVTWMDPIVVWLLAGLALCLLVGGLVYGRLRRAERKRRVGREKFAAAQHAEAQRIVVEETLRQQARRKAAAEEAARAGELKRAEAEAARVRAMQAEAVRAQAAQAEAARVQAAAEAARQQAERLAAETERARQEAAREAAARQAEAARLDAERQAAALAAAATTAAAASAAAAVALPAAKSREQTLVMVADDSKIVRVKTGRLLAQHEYRVAYAIDGLDAAQQLQTAIPDIVITDVEMPGMDGFELTRRVRENPLTAHIPVIMITAAEDRHRDDAKRAGVSIVLGKPYPEEELIAHIRQAMRH
jgi:CheY-like chemotaxis protein